MSERSERERAVVVLLRQLWLGLSAYRLFPGSLDRPGFVAALERIRVAAERALASGELDVEIHGPQLHVDGAPLPSDDAIERLARACFERRAERLVVRAVPDAHDLDGLYAVLSKPLAELETAGGAEAALIAAGVISLALGTIGPQAVEGADHVPEELATEPGAMGIPLPDPAALTADLMLEDLHGDPSAQAETLFGRLQTVVSELPGDLLRNVDLHTTLRDVVTELPPELRRSLVEILVDRVRKDPLAERLIGTMSNAELTRALVDLGRAGRRDPVELARHLAASGVRHLDLVDLTAALEAGHEEAGTILAGLEQLGIDLSDPARRPAAGESVSDVLARYLVATEQDDLRSMEGLLSEGDEQRRAAALSALGEYLSLETDLERIGEVLALWVGETREALRRGDERRVDTLLAIARGALESGDPERSALFEKHARDVLDGALVSELVSAHADVEPSPLPSLLAPFGDAAVESFLDLLAEEEDRTQRAVLLGLLRRITPGHHAPVAARLSDPRWYVVRNAVNILRSAGGAQVLDLLAEAARHDAPEVRREAIWALVVAGGADAIPYLMRLAADAKEEVRTYAVGALGGLVAPEAFAALAEIARTSRDSAVRRRALDELAGQRSEEAEEIVRELASRRSRPRLPRALRRHARALLRHRGEGR